MDFITNQAVKIYFDTTMIYNLKEDDITKFTVSDNMIIIETPKKVYFKSIKYNNEKR